jgi:hypothetical protein
MAVVALVDGVFTFNAVDLTDHVRSVTLEMTANELDASSITDEWDVTKIGRKTGSLAVEFMDDFAASNVDATIWAAFNTGTNVAFALKATSGAISTTNPEYQGTVVPSASPVGGAAGELLMKSVTYKLAGPVTRDVTP